MPTIKVGAKQRKSLPNTMSAYFSRDIKNSDKNITTFKGHVALLLISPKSYFLVLLILVAAGHLLYISINNDYIDSSTGTFIRKIARQLRVLPKHILFSSS